MTARVIPSLTGASPTITEGMLTASSVPEVAPAAWSNATNYGLAARASVSATGNALDVYESIQAANLNHTPASSPLWWKFVGRTYGTYSGATAYVTGDRVIDPAQHLEYLALANSTGAALTDETKWQLQGPTNRWAAFDLIRSTGATTPGPMTFTITPGQRIDAIGLAGLVADRFTIVMTVDGDEVWSHTETLSSRITLNWSDYFFGSFTYRSVSAVFQLPKYSNAEITLTFERTNGDVTVGAIWIGEAVNIGTLETEPDLDRRNFSTIDRDFDGSVILIQRRSVPKHNWTLFLPKNQLPRVTPLQDQLNAVPALWAGLDDPVDEYFEPLLLVAIYTRFTIIPDHAGVRINLELEET